MEHFSKKLNAGRIIKKAIYLERLAIKETIIYWQYWLIRKSFIVFFYHKPLENMNRKLRTVGELGDLIYYRSQYDF